MIAERGELLRAPLFHTPRNPFVEERALECHTDGGLLIRDGRVAACGDYEAVRASHPDAVTSDLRGGFLLPGLIDTHVHFPQLRVLGGLGMPLLEWLEHFALPEEARMASEEYACAVARGFVQALLSHGTTTALVFGAHFAEATAALFATSASRGLRAISGLVLSDRMLRDDLHQMPEMAYRESTALIQRFHGKERCLYAVTPRFALSTTEVMLEVCQTLMREHAGLRFQTHLNENTREIEEVARLFPWATGYLGVYERYGLCGEGAVMAHNVHPGAEELERLAATKTAVAHCPCSNGALGSGLFPMRRHIEAGVRVSMGTDVGGGTGFGMLKEGLQAYMVQRLAPKGLPLDPARLLYLATRAGAVALGLAEETGDFTIGKAADFVYLRAPAASPLAEVVQQADSPERVLAALFTMAGSESVREVRVAGSVVYSSGAA